MSETATVVYNALAAIPNVVLSGIVGSLITVVGVLFTNLGLSRRHREQLEHTARESALKREMELRRDIYIPAIEATIVAMSAIGSMADPTTSQSDVNAKYSDAAAKIGKASSIAKPDTVRALGRLNDSIRALYTRTLINREPMMAAHHRMSAETSMINQNIQERQRWIQMRLDMIYQEGVNEHRDAFLVRQIEFCATMIDEWTTKRDASKLEQDRAILAFLRGTLDLYPEASQAMTNACTAIRSDFAFEHDDLDAIRQVMADNATSALQFMRELATSLEAHVEGNRDQIA